jgi:hypothetical protein
MLWRKGAGVVQSRSSCCWERSSAGGDTGDVAFEIAVNKGHAARSTERQKTSLRCFHYLMTSLSWADATLHLRGTLRMRGVESATRVKEWVLGDRQGGMRDVMY